MFNRLDSNWLSQLPLNHIQSAVAVSGGDINDAYQITTDLKKLFFEGPTSSPSILL
jgi:Fructosamine-3-kinase